MDRDEVLYWSLAQQAIRNGELEERDFWNAEAAKAQRKNHPVKRLFGLLILAIAAGWSLSIYTAIVISLS